MAQCMRRISRLKFLTPSLQQNGSDVLSIQQARVLHAVCPQGICSDPQPVDDCRILLGRAWLLAGTRTLPPRLSHRHHFSSQTPAEEMHEMQEEEFHGEADTLLDSLHEMMDALVDEEDIPGSDVEFGQGVLTLRLGPYGTYVYNKQTPNRQIWMSSPVSGPVRYDLVDGKWIYRRDQHELMGRLTSELRELLGKDVHSI